ncbi:hydroxylysine kinase [Nematostella vectensis]|uniref:hydroxylysine kinase n=1 Tax=Nematostella vectensis TaxID=45351 RepID=UPI002077714A|nr:hydroxylysine kinase [Nematostella vectensis]
MSKRQPRRPNASLETAKTLAKDLYNFTDVLEMREFKSFFDRNFYIRGQVRTENNGNPNKPQEFVLKIHNSLDSENEEVRDAENQLMRMLRDRGFPCPEIIPTRNGQLMEKIHLPASDGQNADGCVVRLLSFVYGQELDSLNKSDVTPELMYTLGKFIGDASKAMKDFSSSALRRRQHTWDIKNFLHIQEQLASIKDDSICSLVTEVHSSFLHFVAPRLSSFRQGTINGDINGENILVTKRGTPGNPTYEITGFLDFSDIEESLLVLEVMAPMIFFMSLGYETSGYILAGYQSSLPLPGDEFDCLYYLAAARLCQLVVYSACNLENDNAQYMQVTVDKYLGILRKFWSCSKEDIEKIWRDCQQ